MFGTKLKEKRTKKWYKSSYRIIESNGGYIGVIHIVRFNPEKGQVGKWYYTPMYPDRDTAKVRIKDTMRDLQNPLKATSMARNFDGDVEKINPKEWVWKPLL